MIYDCFPFFNELDILKIRLDILSKYVDKFVICESTVTHQGWKKELIFQKHAENFAMYKDKIIHIVVDDTPDLPSQVRDVFQKNAVGRGIVECEGNDIIIFGDIDEIPNPSELNKIITNFEKDKIYSMAQLNCYFYFNNVETTGKLLSSAGEFSKVKQKKWLGTKICSGEIARKLNFELAYLRTPNYTLEGIRVQNGGWHLTYMGGENLDLYSRIKIKLGAFAHEEYNKTEIIDNAERLLRRGKDILGREASFSYKSMGDIYPKEIMSCLVNYPHLIMEKTSCSTRFISRVRSYYLKRKDDKYIGKIRKKIWSTINAIKNIDDVSNIKEWNEKKVSWGNENADKTFYVIRRYNCSDEGHGSMVTYVLGHIIEAVEKGYIPVVDLKNCYSYRWQNEEKKGKENAWEYYYEQPMQYTLENIKNSKNIILSSGFPSKYHPNPNRIDIYIDSDVRRKYSQYYKKYIRLKDEVQEKIEKSIQELNIDFDNTIAVSTRRAMEYGKRINSDETKWHDMVPELQEIIRYTATLKKIWRYKTIFLVIDDQEGKEEFEEAFNSSVVCINRERESYFRNGEPIDFCEIQNKRGDLSRQNQEEKIENEIGYLLDLHIMAKCKYIMCTKNSPSVISFLIKGDEYEHFLVGDVMR